MRGKAILRAVLVLSSLALVSCPGDSSNRKNPSVPPDPQVITPATGDTTGGLSVTITGSGFASGATVTIGGNAATAVLVVSDTQITADTPPGTAGPADVLVTNPDAMLGTLSNGFTYFPPATGLFSLTPVVTSLSFPVALAFPPDFPTDDRIFFTEKNTGNVRIIQGGVLLLTPFISVPSSTGCEEGMLGITFDPDYVTNSYVYVFFDPASPQIQRLVRYEDSGNVGINQLILLDNLRRNACNHNGGNIAFGPDGMLYLSLGEDAVPSFSDSFTVFPGKMLRMNPDGSAPTDNPWYDAALPPGSAQNFFFAMGLRNSFDMGFHPLTGDLYASENGPNRNDEVNLIQSGQHYGWDGSRISGPRGSPYIDPVDFFPAPPALTGVGFNSGYHYPEEYFGDMFVGAYGSRRLYRFDLVPPGYTYAPPYTTFMGSPGGGYTDVVGAPDGYIYVATGGGIYRLEYN